MSKAKIIYKRGGREQLRAIVKALALLAAAKHQLLAEKQGGKNAPEKTCAKLELLIINKKSGKVLRTISNGKAGSSSKEAMPKEEIITPKDKKAVTPKKGKQIITPKGKPAVTPKDKQIITPKGTQIVTPKSDRDERRHRFMDLQILNAEALLNELDAPNKLVIVSKITLEERLNAGKAVLKTVKYIVESSIKKASRHKLEMVSDCRATSKKAKPVKPTKEGKASKKDKASKEGKKAKAGKASKAKKSSKA